MASINTKNIAITVDKDALSPSLRLIIEIEFFAEEEAPISCAGDLWVVGGKKIATLSRSRDGYNINGDIIFTDPDLKKKQSEQKRKPKYAKFQMSAELSPSAVNHIENVRAEDPLKEISFKGWLEVTFIKSSTINLQGASHHQLILLQSTEHWTKTINQSEWANEFAGPLGIGKFLLVEFRQLESPTVPSQWIILFKKTHERLCDMENAIKAGDWIKAMQASRKVFDNLKVFDKHKPVHKALEEDFDKAFKADNHPDEGIAELKDAIKKLYHFGSKFAHDPAKDGTISEPEIRVTKEDAYLMYALGLSLLNLLGSKLHRLAEKQSQ